MRMKCVSKHVLSHNMAAAFSKELEIKIQALRLSVLEKLKNSIFDIPIIPRTLNVNK